MLKSLANKTIKFLFVARRYLRGYFFSIFIIKKTGKGLKVGKNVTILNGDYLELGDNCLIEDNCFIDAKSKFGILIGDNVGINRNCYMNCFGMRGGEGIRIGNDVTIGNNTMIYGHALVEVGNYCAIGPNVLIIPENPHSHRNPTIYSFRDRIIPDSSSHMVSNTQGIS